MEKLVLAMLAITALRFAPRLIRSLLRILLRFASTAHGRSGLGRPFVASDIYCIDGDTIACGGLRVRLWGIDAPEMGQPQGPAARRHLIRLLENQTVTVIPMDQDKYGRLVGRLTVMGHDACEKMVIDGYAVAAPRRGGPDYSRSERRARRSRAGLWAQGGIANPASWRAAQA